MLTLLLAAAAVAVALAWRHAARWLRMFWMARTIPGPSNGVLYFAGPLGEVVDKSRVAQQRYGNTVRVWAWPAVNVTVCEPEDLEVVFNSPYLQHKPAIVYGSMSPILGEGLVTLSGDTHRRHRKAIGPSLHLEILQEFVPAFERNALKLCEQLGWLASTGEEFNAVSLLGSYSAHAICETVFSAEAPPILGESKDHFVKYLLEASRLMLSRVMKPWLSWDAVFFFSSQHAEYTRAAQAFEAFVSKMLAYKVDQLRQGDAYTAHGGGRRRKAFLDHVLTSPEGQVLAPRELTEELKTISGAAVGTSTDFMSFFLLVNALLPDVQDRIFKELEDVFGGSERPVEPHDLPHLQYLDCAIKETMRMFPPVFTFSRTVLQDVELPSGHVLPEGCIVAGLPYFTHRDPRHFPDPETFDPSRFLPENSRGRHPYAYIPFSAGSRNCIGQRYAMMSAKILSSSILRRFQVLPSSDGPRTLRDIKLVAGISMSPAGGCNVRVVSRRPRSA
ncbi:Cytochrome P450 CYP4 [Frankliniella occidentalis]|uniref:Cytochrome P450 4V2-like n=1 Tax=Frankliniella occidentalis TaxID=133901 RepID=A0A6J1S6P8_FRAOC|nr:cytochrome P450 4V2-like [Frankliniella occidentalis]KAE8741967.1 Cytochrome P450 CYP4 [Frankliniella occidentalis]